MKGLEDSKGSLALKGFMINSEEQKVKVRDKDRDRDRDKVREAKDLETYLRSLRRYLEEKEARGEVDLGKHSKEREETLW